MNLEELIAESKADPHGCTLAKLPEKRKREIMLAMHPGVSPDYVNAWNDILGRDP